MAHKVYLVKIDSPIDENTFHYLLGFVHKEKKERILKHKIKQNADSTLVGEILAKWLIKKEFGIDFDKQKVAYSEHGKPYLTDYPDVHFNISHSGNVAVCCVADRPVGVDVQKIGEYKPDLARRVCNEEEVKSIEAAQDAALEFTKLWTKKEAVLKMHGVGIAMGDIKNCIDKCDVETELIDDFFISVCSAE